MKIKKILLVVPILVLAFYGAVSAVSDLFSDVSEDAWYAEAVYELRDMGIISGYDDGTFRGSDYINRAEVASIIHEYHKTYVDPLWNDVDMDTEDDFEPLDDSSDEVDLDSDLDDESGDEDIEQPDLGGGSHVRFLNASHSAPSLDIYFNDELVFQGDYGEVTEYYELTPETYSMQIREHGDDPESEALLIATIASASGQYQTITLTDDWMEAEAEVKMFTDDVDVNDEEFEFNVYHLSPDSPELDVLVDETELISNVSYGSITKGLKLLSNEGAIKVYDSEDDTLLAESDFLAFSNGSTYDIFILGKNENESDEEPLEIIVNGN